MAKAARWPKLLGARCACPACGHRARDRHGGAAATVAAVGGPGFGLHGELHRDMGGLPGKERRMGSHQRRGAAVRWRLAVPGGLLLHSDGSPAVTCVSVVVLQLEKRRGGELRVVLHGGGRHQKQGKAAVLRPISTVASFGQGVEGGKEGCCAQRLEASRERRGGRDDDSGGHPFYARQGGDWVVRYRAGAGTR
jgi:hypothetical protein